MMHTHLPHTFTVCLTSMEIQQLRILHTAKQNTCDPTCAAHLLNKWTNMKPCVCSAAFWTVDKYWIMNTGLKLCLTQTNPDSRDGNQNKTHTADTCRWLARISRLLCYQEKVKWWIIDPPVSLTPAPSVGESEVRGQYSTPGAVRVTCLETL